MVFLEEVYDSIQRWLKASHSEHREEERGELSSMKRRLQAQADELTELRKMVTNGEEVQDMLRQAHSQLVCDYSSSSCSTITLSC